MATQPHPAPQSAPRSSWQPRCTISSCWNDPEALAPYRSGVSLHSHTSMSEETMTFVHKFLGLLPGLPHIFAHYQRRSVDRGFQLDFVRGHWRPPLVPRMAFDLEAAQIREAGLDPLVSLTDHDTVAAPQLLRSVASTRGIPVSLEWTVPFGATEFHLGIHNLPSAEAYAWMTRLAQYTAAATAPPGGEASTPNETPSGKPNQKPSGKPNKEQLGTLLAELDDTPGVLIILNHPIWDLYKIGADQHRRELARFLSSYGHCLHALELNGLRDGRENRAVAKLARETGHLLISGGDRHGTEPSACINLSHARNFREFVDEIRLERHSHVLFMPQYRRPWEQRILHSTLDAVTDFPDFPEGWQRWDERAFHPNRHGEMRPLSQLWPDGKAPIPLRLAVQLVRLGRNQALSRAFSLGFGEHIDAHAELELL